MKTLTKISVVAFAALIGTAMLGFSNGCQSGLPGLIFPAASNTLDSDRGGDGSKTPPGSIELLAVLKGPGFEHGDARYRQIGTRRSLKIELEDALPGSTYKMFVDAESVGELLIGEFGHGEIEFDTSIQRNHVPWPNNLPLDLKEGARITVGPTVGVMTSVVTPDPTGGNGNDNTANDNVVDNGNDNTANDNIDDNGNDNTANDNVDDNGNDNTANDNVDDNGNDNTANDNVDDNGNDNTANDNTGGNGNDNGDGGPSGGSGAEIDLETVLSGPNGLHGDARFRRKDGRSRLKVEIEHASPGSLHLILVDGEMIGSVMIGPLGEGEVEFDTALEPGHIPWPMNLPLELGAGTVIQAGDAVGTL